MPETRLVHAVVKTFQSGDIDMKWEYELTLIEDEGELKAGSPAHLHINDVAVCNDCHKSMSSRRAEILNKELEEQNSTRRWIQIEDFNEY
jgi:hypothetical protein